MQRPEAARDDADASILFAGGDTRFLQYAFDKLALPGVTSEAGVADDTAKRTALSLLQTLARAAS